MSNSVIIRPATSADRADLRRAIVELQEHERRLHATRRPGEAIADAYLAWLEERAVAAGGVILVAVAAGEFAGFAAGWVEETESIAETPDSNRFGYVSDLCILPGYRGRRIAGLLLAALENVLAAAGITRLRLSTLAMNDAARRTYDRAGLAPYEIVYEKLVRGSS